MKECLKKSCSSMDMEDFFMVITDPFSTKIRIVFHIILVCGKWIENMVHLES